MKKALDIYHKAAPKYFQKKDCITGCYRSGGYASINIGESRYPSTKKIL
jgi:hypothetical protein